MLQGFGEIIAVAHDADDHRVVILAGAAAKQRKQAGQRGKGKAVEAPTGEGHGRHDGPLP